MKRRAFLSLFQASVVATPQKFAAVNSPRCPLCQTSVPANTPAYLPIVQNVSDRTTAALPNLRDMFCANCGIRWVTSA
jgi:hypothetical protein